MPSQEIKLNQVVSNGVVDLPVNGKENLDVFVENLNLIEKEIYIELMQLKMAHKMRVQTRIEGLKKIDQLLEEKLKRTAI